jgi:hypothetical protein
MSVLPLDFYGPNLNAFMSMSERLRCLTQPGAQIANLRNHEGEYGPRAFVILKSNLMNITGLVCIGARVKSLNNPTAADLTELARELGRMGFKVVPKEG